MSHTEKFQTYVSAMQDTGIVHFEGDLQAKFERLARFAENWFAQGLISAEVSKKLSYLADELEGIKTIRNIENRIAAYNKWLVELNAVVLVEQPAEEAEEAAAAKTEIEMGAKYIQMDNGQYGVPMLDGYTHPVSVVTETSEPTMLEVTVVRTTGTNEFDYKRYEHLVQIRGVDKLTPKTARQAIAIAFGGKGNASVYDHKAGYGYRVYGSSARKVKMEGDAS